MLAFASADFSDVSIPAPGKASPMGNAAPYDRQTAVYDITARTVAGIMSGLLGYQVVVDNRLGAAGNIELAAHSAPDVVPRFALDGSYPVGSLPQEFAAHIKREIAKYATVTKDAGMKIDETLKGSMS